jgi:beta-carotene ketolase (CrtW type)
MQEINTRVWDNPRVTSAIGGMLAIAIVGLWILSLALLLSLNLGDMGWGWLLLALLARTFLHTGLFILAHDAMHRSLLPSYPRGNDLLGAIALCLYACLPYHSCRLNHARHHRYPAQTGDPDFHDGINSQPWRWYLKFMSEYLSIKQWSLFLGVVCVVSAIAIGVYHLSPFRLLWWWILPLLLSSIQLFVFGTYLPHRRTEEGNAHRAHTIDYPLLWSFLTCYHFGYHWEHHEYPQTPWYRLPALYLQARSGDSTKPTLRERVVRSSSPNMSK